MSIRLMLGCAVRRVGGARGVGRAGAPRSTWGGLIALLLLTGCAPATLRVATSGDYPPFSTVSAEGVRGGLDVVIAERLARDLGLRIAWVAFAWPDLSAALERGAFDVALSGVTMRAERAVIGRYALPYALTRALPVVRPADAARWSSSAALDRPGVRLAVNAGGHLERVARGHFPRATIVPIAGNRIVAALADRDIDAVITDSAELAAWPPDAPPPLALPALTVDHKAPLLPADGGALAGRIDEWLMAREADGWLDAQRIRALGAAASLDLLAARQQAVAALIRLRLDLMPDVANAKRRAGLPLEDLAQEARVLERVRGQVPDRPEVAVALFAEIIRLAKAVQRAAPVRAGGPSLAALRAGLARIDETLCRALAWLPDRSPPPAWQRVFEENGVAADAAARLAAIASGGGE